MRPVSAPPPPSPPTYDRPNQTGPENNGETKAAKATLIERAGKPSKATGAQRAREREREKPE